MTLSKFQRFEPRRIWRSSMKPHPDNPRVILPKNRKQLKAILKTIGAVEPPTWNERSGYQLGFHQRLSIIDELEKGKDYELDVCVVDLSPEEEAAVLIALNNPEAQGQWDFERLGALLAKPGVVLEHTGFTLADLPGMFEQHPLIPLPAPPAAVVGAVNAQAPPPAQCGKGVKGAHGKSAEDYRADIDGYRNRTDSEATDCGYVVVVCESLEQRVELMRALGAPEQDRYVEARTVLDLLKAQ